MYDIAKDAVECYKRILNNEIKSFSTNNFFIQPYKKQREVAVIRYAVENILKVSPEDALGKLSNKFLVENKLLILLKTVPANDLLFDDTNDFLVYYAYPELPFPTIEETSLSIYKEMLNGKRRRFPSNFFTEPYFKERIKVCVKYLLEDIYKYDIITIRELFSTGKISGLLLKNKLAYVHQIYPYKSNLYKLVYEN